MMFSARSGPSRQSRGGPLFFIAVLMIGSALLRLGLQAGPALARDLAAPPSDAQPGQTRETTEHARLNKVLQELLKRDAALKRQETEMQDRLKALEIADQAIESRLLALAEAEESLRATMAMAEVAAENDLARLTDVYAKMKPKEAAALFEEMDPGFAAGFLARMPPETAAGIMAGLSPQAAYTISVVLAGRNAAAPRE